MPQKGTLCLNVQEVWRTRRTHTGHLDGEVGASQKLSVKTTNAIITVITMMVKPSPWMMPLMRVQSQEKAKSMLLRAHRTPHLIATNHHHSPSIASRPCQTAPRLRIRTLTCLPWKATLPTSDPLMWISISYSLPRHRPQQTSNKLNGA